MPKLLSRPSADRFQHLSAHSQVCCLKAEDSDITPGRNQISSPETLADPLSFPLGPCWQKGRIEPSSRGSWAGGEGICRAELPGVLIASRFGLLVDVSAGSICFLSSGRRRNTTAVSPRGPAAVVPDRSVRLEPGDESPARGAVRRRRRIAKPGRSVDLADRIGRVHPAGQLMPEGAVCKRVEMWF